MNPSIS
jgi:hypothetical protein